MPIPAPEVIKERAAKITRISHSSHPTREQGMCVMECVAYLADEIHSDHPQCACPVLTQIGIRLNDSTDFDTRQRLLRPLLVRLVGSRGSDELTKKRGYAALNFILKRHPDTKELAKDTCITTPEQAIEFRRQHADKIGVDMNDALILAGKDNVVHAVGFAARSFTLVHGYTADAAHLMDQLLQITD